MRKQDQGYEILDNTTENVLLAFTIPFFKDLQVHVTDVDEAFVNATYQTNKNRYELYALVVERDLVTVPISYILLKIRSEAQKVMMKERARNKKY